MISNLRKGALKRKRKCFDSFLIHCVCVCVCCEWKRLLFCVEKQRFVHIIEFQSYYCFFSSSNVLAVLTAYCCLSILLAIRCTYGRRISTARIVSHERTNVNQVENNNLTRFRLFNGLSNKKSRWHKTQMTKGMHTLDTHYTLHICPFVQFNQ